MMQTAPFGEQEALAQLVLKMRARGLEDLSLFSALERVPRRFFIPILYSDNPYDNKIIPIECGEYIERLEEQLRIISALDLKTKHRVLEIGTGSGFTAALMSKLSGRVTTIERYKTLIDLARQRFNNLHIDNIILRQMDGSHIQSSLGPFDRIIIWPSSKNEPNAYLDLLAGNGVLIQAIGGSEEAQMLMRYQKIGVQFESSDMFKVRYQPFIEGVASAL